MASASPGFFGGVFFLVASLSMSPVTLSFLFPSRLLLHFLLLLHPLLPHLLLHPLPLLLPLPPHPFWSAHGLYDIFCLFPGISVSLVPWFFYQVTLFYFHTVIGSHVLEGYLWMVCLSDPDHYSTRQGDLGDQGFALLMSVSAGPRIVPGKCWGGGEHQ